PGADRCDLRNEPLLARAQASRAVVGCWIDAPALAYVKWRLSMAHDKKHLLSYFEVRLCLRKARLDPLRFSPRSLCEGRTRTSLDVRSWSAPRSTLSWRSSQRSDGN